ncbi:MAG: hypothetical protein KDA36_02090 [Planctomycetaceae bacterium]|nr:hypothetical protein [Planctomycetaceae bacterium]
MGERTASGGVIDLRHTTVVIREGELPAAEGIAPVILTEEVQKRTGMNWNVVGEPDYGPLPAILLSNAGNLPGWKKEIPAELLNDPILKKPEGYCIRVVRVAEGGAVRIHVIGSDARGVMFGVGQLLRRMDLAAGMASLADEFQISTAPDRAIRGHQIGYRPRANSWDAWTIEQFDQYFRDMVVFGANCMENIPFQDDDPHPLMKYSREQMNVEFAKLCVKYDLDHWVWVPVEFPVAEDAAKREEFLKQQEAFYKACPRLDAIFVPGGDPGDNPCTPLMPYLEKMAMVAQKFHPKAKVWLSLQGFKKDDIEDFYSYIETNKPEWFGGAVMGPSSPPMEITRQRLPKQYPLRWYPDITHIVRCQYPIPWLDPIWGLTIGREGVNPRPEDYAAIYENDFRLTDGFLSYSDGIHDDFNKNLWTQLAWDPKRPVREITRDYARHFFRSDLGDVGADAILGLEANLRGPTVSNGSVAGTLRLWQEMEQSFGNSARDWRFNMHLFRAYYDAYTRERAIYEADLEKQGLAHLTKAESTNIAKVIPEAIEILNKAESIPTRGDLFAKVQSLADHLFATIGYQTSVPKYGASGFERGCMMDYVNYPLNNRWWIEDRLNEILSMQNKEEQLTRISQIVNWENPGAGGYYETIGDVGRSHHMIRLQNAGDSMRHYYDIPMPTQRNIGPQRNPLRLSFHVYHDLIPGLKYDALDPQGKYTVKLFAQRESPMMIDGEPAKRIRIGEKYDQVSEQEFEVPAETLKDGKIELTWAPLEQRHLNWRQHHYVTDVWVIRKE